MDINLQAWIVIAVNAAAAVAFQGFGRHWDSRYLQGVGIAFFVAMLLVAGAPLFQSSSTATTCGYAVGFVASVLGFLGLLKAYLARQAPRASEGDDGLPKADRPGPDEEQAEKTFL